MNNVSDWKLTTQLIMTIFAASLAACTEKKVVTAEIGSTNLSQMITKANATRPSNIPKTLITSSSCSFDRFDGLARETVSVVKDKSKVNLNGWMGNPASTGAPGPIVLEMDGPSKFYFAGKRSLKRPDVAAALKKPVLVDSGWESNVDLSAVPPGSYKLHLIMLDEQSGSVCDPNGTIVVK